MLLALLDAGDHLEVLPCNNPALVNNGLNLLNISGDEVYSWTPNPQGAARGFNLPRTDQQKPNNSQNNSHVNGVGAGELPQTLPLSSKDILAWFVDLSAVPDRRTVSQLAERCVCPPEAAALKKLAAEDVYAEKVWHLYLSSQLASVHIQLHTRHSCLLMLRFCYMNGTFLFCIAHGGLVAVSWHNHQLLSCFCLCDIHAF